MSMLDLLKVPAKPAATPTSARTAEDFAARVMAERNPVVHQELRRVQKDDPHWQEERGEHWPRILGLGTRKRVPDGEAEQLTHLSHFSYRLADALAYDEGFRFRAAQADCIQQFMDVGGLLSQVKVGGGKTLISVCIANHAARQGTKRILIFVPASVYQQFMQVDLPRIRTWIPLAIRIYGMGDLNPPNRKRIATTAGPGAWVMPYSLLSNRDADELLAAIKPELIVGDEAHYLKNRESARTKRVTRYYSANPKTRFAWMSGTITNKQLLDYHHLAVMALGEKAPMPTSAQGGARWNSILSAESLVDVVDAGRDLAPLHKWSCAQIGNLPYTIDGYRTAYRHRLDSAPGVVLTREGELGCTLVFKNLEVPEPGEDLTQKMKAVTEQWLAPNGDEIAHAFHTYKWLYELTSGFYYDLVWPEAKSEEHAERIAKAKVHHMLRQLYERELRSFLQATSIPRLDTPMFVGAALSNPERAKLLPKSLQERWHTMKDAEFPGMPQRKSVPVRVDDYKVRLAVQWAQDAKGGILWCHHDEVIDWICEELRRAGVDHYPAKSGDLQILDHANRDRIAVASIMSHFEGKNLQYHYHRQLVLQWPRSAKVAEQMLGRTHREGQPEEEITACLALGPEWDHQNFAATLCEALYMKLTTYQDQKVLYGNYVTPPRIYDPRILEHCGFENVDKVKEGDLRRQFGATR